jgi:hypothetical protein
MHAEKQQEEENRRRSMNVDILEGALVGAGIVTLAFLGFGRFTSWRADKPVVIETVYADWRWPRRPSWALPERDSIQVPVGENGANIDTPVIAAMALDEGRDYGDECKPPVAGEASPGLVFSLEELSRLLSIKLKYAGLREERRASDR